ncbi:MAG: hypothetical protein HY898_36235 [Deltaproteobacteria bacterium]|nr:hypothetical protein [Deltaproteobacteria bacterium]
MKTAISSVLLGIVGLLTIGCDSEPGLERVDLVAENKPPLSVTVAGAGVTLPVGIGVAVVVKPIIEGKEVEDTMELACQTDSCTAQKGTGSNEYFIVGIKAGKGTLYAATVSRGAVQVPITVTEQN